MSINFLPISLSFSILVLPVTEITFFPLNTIISSLAIIREGPSGIIKFKVLIQMISHFIIKMKLKAVNHISYYPPYKKFGGHINFNSSQLWRCRYQPFFFIYLFIVPDQH